MQNSRYSYAHGGLSSLKEARDLLHKHAPKGEHLAYINPQEAALLKAHGGSGIMTASGIPSYFSLKSISKSISNLIPKEISNTLNKIIPNEIKPALPYAAAFAPFLFPGLGAGIGSMLGASGTIGGLSIPSMVGSGILKLGSDLSQENYPKVGINPISLGLNAVTAGMAAPGSSEAIANERILGNINNVPFTGADAAKVIPTFGPEGSMLPPNSILTPTTTLQDAQNFLNTGLQTGAKFSEVPEGGLTPFSGNPGDFTAAAKKLIIPSTTTTMERAAIKAKEIQDEYDKKMGNIKNMTQADLAERRKYVQQYMAMAGFNQDQIDSALSRQGLMMGGRAAYEAGSNNEGVKTIPISLDKIAYDLFKDKLDNLTYTQKESVYNRYYDLKDKKADGGLMSLGGHEMDFRAAGGFVPIGKKERADDVPARLSKNEFVFTAKAVRNAGHGDIKAGAKRMYQLMKHLEAR
jgi:hypothetical protein